MFGSSAAVALAVAVEAELASQQADRGRGGRSARKAARGPAGPKEASAATPREAEGERLTRDLHDHIHQIAHLRNTVSLADLREQVESWLETEPA